MFLHSSVVRPMIGISREKFKVVIKVGRRIMMENEKNFAKKLTAGPTWRSSCDKKC